MNPISRWTGCDRIDLRFSKLRAGEKMNRAQICQLHVFPKAMHACKHHVVEHHLRMALECLRIMWKGVTTVGRLGGLALNAAGAEASAAGLLLVALALPTGLPRLSRLPPLL
jgi:hypothetical protein